MRGPARAQPARTALSLQFCRCFSFCAQVSTFDQQLPFLVLFALIFAVTQIYVFYFFRVLKIGTIARYRRDEARYLCVNQSAVNEYRSTVKL